MRSWQLIKTENVHFVEKFPQFNNQHQFCLWHPSRRLVANMAEAVNLQCYYCNQQGHAKRDCLIRKVDLEAKGLNIDQVYEEERKGSLAKKCSRSHGNGGGSKVETSVEVGKEDTKAVVVMEMVGDGVVTMVVVGTGS